MGPCNCSYSHLPSPTKLPGFGSVFVALKSTEPGSAPECVSGQRIMSSFHSTGSLATSFPYPLSCPPLRCSRAWDFNCPPWQNRCATWWPSPGTPCPAPAWMMAARDITSQGLCPKLCNSLCVELQKSKSKVWCHFESPYFTFIKSASPCQIDIGHPASLAGAQDFRLLA